MRPEIFFRNNTASALSLLEAILAHGPRRLVFSSTAAVYGEPEMIPIKEDARLLRPTPMASRNCWWSRCWAGSTAFTASFRLAALLQRGRSGGRGEGITRGEAHEPESHLIPLVLDVALGRRKSIKIFGEDYPTPDGTCIRDYIHVSDLADAHLLALKALEEQERLIFNLGNGKGFSVREVIESARRVTGHPIPAEV